MNFHRLPFIVTSIALSACSIESAFETVEHNNVCVSDSDCGEGAACVVLLTEQSACAAQSSELGAVILQVATTSGNGASHVFYESLTLQGDDSAGLLKNLDLRLPEPVSFSATMTSPSSTAPARCKAADQSIPLKAVLHRRADFGPFRSDYAAEAVIDAEGASAPFTIAVPPGQYDVYLQPKVPADTTVDECAAPAAPPRLVRDVIITEGMGIVEFEPAADDEPKTLTAMLTAPEGSELTGWALEIIDPTYGHVLSEAPSAELGVGEQTIRYYHTPKPLVRLRDGSGELSVHWDLETLDFNSDNTVVIDLGDLLAAKMPIDAHVIADNVPVANATVKIQSISLTGSAQNNATFTVTTTTDEAGGIAVELVEGTYQVIIVPEVSGVATHSTEWEITSPDGGSGKGFVLELQPILKGNVVDPRFDPIALAPIVAGPSQSTANDYFSQFLVEPPTVIRQLSSIAAADGSFTLPVDPGAIDFVVQLPSESLYPWLVVPGLLVDNSVPNVALGELQVRYPAIAQGEISDVSGPAPFAVVRAWVQSKTGDELGPLVEIGATTTDAFGLFVLPLPPSITLEAPEATEAQ